jgi:hypothetical protein
VLLTSQPTNQPDALAIHIIYTTCEAIVGLQRMDEGMDHLVKDCILNLLMDDQVRSGHASVRTNLEVYF